MTMSSDEIDAALVELDYEEMLEQTGRTSDMDTDQLIEYIDKQLKVKP